MVCLVPDKQGLYHVIIKFLGGVISAMGSSIYLNTDGLTGDILVLYVFEN